MFLDAEEENSANTPPTIQGEARVNSCATAESVRMRRGEELQEEDNKR